MTYKTTTQLAIYVICLLLITPSVYAAETGDPKWGFMFTVPAGWVHQKTEEGVVLGHKKIQGRILIIPHNDATYRQVINSMKDGLSEDGISLKLIGNIKKIDKSSVSCNYTGKFQGQQVKSFGIGTLSPFLGGAYIIALGLPNEFNAELFQTVKIIAKNIKYTRKK